MNLKNHEVKIPVVRRPGTEDLPLPRYMTEGSAGMDLYAAIDMPVVLNPGERALIPTGLMISIPIGYEGQVRPRSGLAFRHGITVLNAPGTIDSDYRGEIQVILINFGKEPFSINRADRIAQFIISPVVKAYWEEVIDLDITTRAAGGFGHTGS